MERNDENCEKQKQSRANGRCDLMQAGQGDRQFILNLGNLLTPNPKRVRYRAALRPDTSCKVVPPRTPFIDRRSP